ncbi:tetratricopeptide repeat protein, partial [bacterium]|nr:tetratricopeptide repeat protein [bacterium]
MRGSLRKYAHGLLCCLLITQLLGCGGAQTIGDLKPDATLAELPRASLPAANTFAPESLAVIADGYREALTLIGDPVMREDILRRLALLDLRVAEDRQINDERTPATEIYANAINTYTTLLREQQHRQDNDKLLYPLAKAYELSGDIDKALSTMTQIADNYPDSEYYSEVQFRRGEILFSRELYP